MRKKYIDLNLIKRLVGELENFNEQIEVLIEEKSESTETQLEIAKAVGLALFIINEAELLASDYKKLSSLILTEDTGGINISKISAEDLYDSLGIIKKKTSKN